ncbi:MAG: N-acetyltransferase [Bacteroidetes bacterium]|nr:N-acetyltransferase [Bacteroidota bacterium]
MTILEPPRLALREFTEEDAENAYLLNLDPEVVRYTGDGPFESIEAARIFLKNYPDYKKHGYGRWAVIEKSSNEFLGWCGLKYIEELNEYDIGYRFFRKHWGKGFATESAKACLAYGFEKLQLPFVVGRAAKENTASIHVLEKIGLNYHRAGVFHGDDSVVYRLENQK